MIPNIWPTKSPSPWYGKIPRAAAPPSRFMACRKLRYAGDLGRVSNVRFSWVNVGEYYGKCWLPCCVFFMLVMLENVQWYVQPHVHNGWRMVVPSKIGGFHGDGFPMITYYRGFHKWGYPNSWMVSFMEKPIKCMRTGVPYFGKAPFGGNEFCLQKMG